LPGTAVTVTGTHFETIPTNNSTKVNITPSAISSSTASSIITTVPTATSGRISVATPAGAAVSSGDFFVPPPPYTVADVVLTGRIAFGETKPVAINTGGKIGLYLFDGVAGRRASLNVSNRTIPTCVVTIYSPDRSVLTTNALSAGQGDKFYEPKTLPISGTYTILAASTGSSTGSMNLTLYDVPPDTSGTIAIAGPPVTVTLSPGQNGSLTFSATAGQKVSLSTSNSTIYLCDVIIKKPDGSEVGAIFPAGMGS
jgi:IPT/TIG domain-containing protein